MKTFTKKVYSIRVLSTYLIPNSQPALRDVCTVNVPFVVVRSACTHNNNNNNITRRCRFYDRRKSRHLSSETAREVH